MRSILEVGSEQLPVFYSSAFFFSYPVFLLPFLSCFPAALSAFSEVPFTRSCLSGNQDFIFGIRFLPDTATILPFALPIGKQSRKIRKKPQKNRPDSGKY